MSTNFPDFFWNSPTLKNVRFTLTVATLIILFQRVIFQLNSKMNFTTVSRADYFAW